MSSRSSSSPPQFENLHHVGYVRSAHGIRGELAVKLLAGHADWLNRASNLALLAPNAERPTTLAIKAVRPHKDGLLVVFAEVRDRNEAEALKGAQVYVAEDLLEAAKGEPIFLKEILGFAVIDPGGVGLGEIVDFATNGAQDLLVLKRASDGRRALVPFVDAFIVGIDFDARVVRMDLPDGLLDLDR